MLAPEIATRVRDALFAQKYNLLLGAGVSLDSSNQYGKPLKSAEALRQQLCSLTQARDSSPLWRVAGLLTPEQVEANITKEFRGVRAGSTVKSLTRFAWKMAFTLNVDDAVENAYESTRDSLQDLQSVNYSREYETFRNPSELPLIHLHGFSREPESGYVFSLQEYVGVQRGVNPWVNALSGLIISEPFIIAGTALFEPDLEYFLAHRPSHSDVLARAPSILVEPYPDAGTKRDCERLNLVLVEAKFDEFLQWLTNEFGPSPSPAKLREPQHKPRLLGQPEAYVAAAFWADFQFVGPSESSQTSPEEASAFNFGRPPTWEELKDGRDVPLKSQLPVLDEVRRWANSTDGSKFVVWHGKAGSGATTSVKRIALELANHKLPVFFVQAMESLDLNAAVLYLSNVIDPIILITDRLAEHAENLLDIANSLATSKRVCIIGAERQYRTRLIKELLDESQVSYMEAGKWRSEEHAELIRRYARFGLVGDKSAIVNPRAFSAEIQGDAASEAVCRILNDFRPLRAIVRSLWNDTLADARPAYLVVALAYYCHPIGLRRQILLPLWPAGLLRELELKDAPLAVSENPDNDEYLVPINATLAALLVEEMSRQKPERLLAFAVQLADVLAPFVTRHSIRQRTAEARLAGRLFDSDGVMPDLLKSKFDDFLKETAAKWGWNSRYWEQRALRILATDPVLATQHARQAVAIERHPFPMTTLATVLFARAAADPQNGASYFREALDLMQDALRIESTWARGRTQRGFWALLDGVTAFMAGGGALGNAQQPVVQQALQDVQRRFDASSQVFQKALALADLLRAEKDRKR